MFWNKNNNRINKITTTITKTSLQSQKEKENKNTIYLKSTTCPHCKHVSDDSISTFPQTIQDTNICVLGSKCIKCGTEWDTQYKSY